MNSISSAYALHLAFLESLRKGSDGDEGEGRFGLVPFSLSPNRIHAVSDHHANLSLGGVLPHPLLSRSAQFSGIAPSLTADPINNEAAKKDYPQLRYQLQQTLAHKSRPRRGWQPPRLTRG